jgi:hypothetical protein
MTDGPTLNYAPPKRRIRRPIMWSVIALFVIIFTLGPVISFYNWADRRLTLWRMYNDCAALRVPDGSAVYLESGDLAGETGVEIRPLSNRLTLGSFGTLKRGYGQLDGLCWRIQPAVRFTNCLLFCHERTTRSSNTVLVAISLQSFRHHFNEPGEPMKVAAVTITPVTLLSNDLPTMTPVPITIGAWPDPDTRTRFFHGQPDPADASRFTIPYDIGRAAGVIDGVLNDDLTITLTPRTGPLATPTTMPGISPAQ